MDRVLVTGASGFIGSLAVRALTNAGNEVTGLGRRPGQAATYRRLDLTDETETRKLFQEMSFSAVVHAAASAVRSAGEAGRENNLITTRNIVRAAKVSGVSRFVFLSSNAVYGRGYHALSDTPVQPFDWYGESKVEGEKSVRESSPPLASLVLRLPSVLGPNALADNVAAAMVRSLLEKDEIELFGGGEARRQFLDSQDLGRVLVAALGVVPVPGVRTVSVVGPEAIRLKDLAQALVEIHGSGRICYLREKSDSPDQFVDPKPLADLVGFSPSRPLADSLRDLYASLKAAR